MKRKPEDQRAPGQYSMADSTSGGNIHRADGTNRLGLCQQQFSAGGRFVLPDQSGPFGADAGVEGQGEAAERAAEARAISVKKSITPDHIVCLEDGKKFKSLKRHLRTQYSMTPEQYREKWGAAAGLSDGGAELCSRALAARQADGPRPAAPASPQVAPAAGSTQRIEIKAAASRARVFRIDSLQPTLDLRIKFLYET